MPADMERNNLEAGDWVHVSDDLHPFTINGSMPARGRYGSPCRSAVITREYMDGIVTVMFENMYDFRSLSNGPFTYSVNVYADELLRIMTAEEYAEQGRLAAETPHVIEAAEERTPQPRDERGRFCSPRASMTYEAPIVADDLKVGYYATNGEVDRLTEGMNRAQSDTVMAMWASAMASTNTLSESFASVGNNA